jgi:hypothetical protein
MAVTGLQLTMEKGWQTADVEIMYCTEEAGKFP